MSASNLSKNISPLRLAIRTRGATISRPILPLKVLTIIEENFPATTTPELKHLLKKGVALCHKNENRKGTKN